VARTGLRLADARAALAALEDVLAVDRPNERDRDSALLNLMLATETVWKAAQAVVADVVGPRGVFPSGPKAAVRECRAAGILTDADAELAFKALEDRNLVVHTYKKALAVEIHGRIATHAGVLRRWLAALEDAARDAGEDVRTP
jgi:uncharacterized protein YutE (UPF0331/DUF86 family)